MIPRRCWCVRRPRRPAPPLSGLPRAGCGARAPRAARSKPPWDGGGRPPLDSRRCRPRQIPETPPPLHPCAPLTVRGARQARVGGGFFDPRPLPPRERQRRRHRPPVVHPLGGLRRLHVRRAQRVQRALQPRQRAPPGGGQRKPPGAPPFRGVPGGRASPPGRLSRVPGRRPPAGSRKGFRLCGGPARGRARQGSGKRPVAT